MKLEMEREIISQIAEEITNLWWAKPEENGHIKAQIVREIIQKHFWGFTEQDIHRVKSMHLKAPIRCCMATFQTIEDWKAHASPACLPRNIQPGR